MLLNIRGSKGYEHFLSKAALLHYDCLLSSGSSTTRYLYCFVVMWTQCSSHCKIYQLDDSGLIPSPLYAAQQPHNNSLSQNIYAIIYTLLSDFNEIDLSEGHNQALWCRIINTAGQGKKSVSQLCVQWEYKPSAWEYLLDIVECWGTWLMVNITQSFRARARLALTCL